MLNPKILVIEDDPSWIKIVSEALYAALGADIQIDTVETHLAARTKIENEDYELVSVDLELPEDPADLERSDLAGMVLLKQIRSNLRNSDCAVLVLTAHPTFERVRQALRYYRVFDFFDKFNFQDERRNYCDAVQSSIRSVLLSRANHNSRDGCRYSIRFDGERFLSGELTTPHYREAYTVENPLPVNFSDFGHRADVVNSSLLYGKVGDWRKEARDIGETFARTILAHEELSTGLTAARLLTNKRPSDLFLEFSGPPCGLSLPYELLRAEGEFLAIEHVISRRIEGRSKLIRSAEPFWKFIEVLVTTHQTLRILIVGVDSDGRVPASEEEALRLADFLEMRLHQLGIRHHVTRVVGRDATRSNVKDKLASGYHLFHYAGHSTHSRTLAEASPIVLADGTLTASDLKTIIRETDLRLAFLSSCLGAMTASRVGRGDFHGFLDALSQSGVPTIIGYRWVVVDESASQLAADFYRSLFHDFCPGRAMLRARQRCTIISASRRDDATWASPVLILRS